MIKFLGGNQLTLLQNGVEYFPALEAAIDQAQHHVFLETYIYAHDDAGQRIAGALMRAAQRGVATHLVIDGYGAQDYPFTAREALRKAGVKLLVYRPQISPWRFPRQHLRRLHRKLAVIDQRCAFVGGINIINDSNTPGAPPQYDYAVRVEGLLVNVILREAHNLHTRLAWAQLRQPRRTQPAPLPVPEAAGHMRAAFLLRSNLRHRRDIERAYLRAIGKAKHEIILANPYFLPGRRFRKALIHAAARGVKVKLLLQGEVEFRIVQYASRALYKQLLAAGIQIYEYQPSILHAKVAVIDGRWATVGSSNIDPTSLFVSREANLVAYDHDFAAILQASLDSAIAHDARQITADGFSNGSWMQRSLHWLAYSGVRLLAGWVGYGREME
jgi:cardiolipin synthase